MDDYTSHVNSVGRVAPARPEIIQKKFEKPRTDVGTLVLHWATAIAFTVSLLTGLRIAADALHAPVSKWISPILPQGEIWTWHFLAGVTLFFCATAYASFMLRSGLSQRNTLKKIRVLIMNAPRAMKWGAVNVILHWFVYGLIVVLLITGVILYAGYGGWWVYIHSTAAFVGLAYVFVHALAHYFHGGWQHILRVFRPARLIITSAVRPKPLLIASLIGVATVGAVAVADWATRDTLLVVADKDAPTLDGVADERSWANTRPVIVETQQGANLGGSGASTVEVRATHDGQRIYFAFRWTDPTRSLRRIPIIKKESGWHLVDDRADRMDVVDFYEDKFSLILSDQPSFGGAGVARLGTDPLASGAPRPLNERGFHYTSDGTFVDMWQWKASRGGALGYVDDQYIGPPREPSAADASYNARYQGGYWNDPGRAFYSYNFKFVRKGEGTGSITPIRLPKHWQTQVAALGKVDLNPNSNDDENGRWYMLENESEPYTADVDAKIPVGTVLPGVLIMGNYEGDRADLRGAARWKDGHWTLEVARNLTTGSKYDKDFVAGRDLYLWVAVFDHAQTRHTRHARPVRVRVKD